MGGGRGGAVEGSGKSPREDSLSSFLISLFLLFKWKRNKTHAKTGTTHLLFGPLCNVAGDAPLVVICGRARPTSVEPEQQGANLCRLRFQHAEAKKKFVLQSCVDDCLNQTLLINVANTNLEKNKEKGLIRWIFFTATIYIYKYIQPLTPHPIHYIIIYKIQPCKTEPRCVRIPPLTSKLVKMSFGPKVKALLVCGRTENNPISLILRTTITVSVMNNKLLYFF